MRHRRYSKYFPVLFLAMDIMSLILAFCLAGLARFGFLPFQLPGYYNLLVAEIVLWSFVFFAGRLNIVDREKSLHEQFSKVISSLVINLLIVLAIWFVMKPYEYSRQHLFFTYTFFLVLLFCWRSIWYYLIRYYRKRGFNYRNVVFIGYEGLSKSMISFIRSTPSLGYKVVGVFDDSNVESNYFKGSISEVEKYVANNNVDIFFCNLNVVGKERLQILVNLADSNLVKVKILSQFSKMELHNLSVQNYGFIPVLNVNAIPLDNWFNQFVKRAFDIVFSLAVILLILSWLAPLLALLIKLESEGPVFFRQKRHGKGNLPFYCWKFRTMVFTPEAGNFSQARKNDNRVTKLGSFLRRTSIDELPQFLNVLIGEMSVVGPRPHAIQHNEQYQPAIEKFWQRHAVKPGITGLAQAKGFRGETDLAAMSGRVKLDRFYVKNWSLLLDLKIILLTIASFLRGSENAY